MKLKHLLLVSATALNVSVFAQSVTNGNKIQTGSSGMEEAVCSMKESTANFFKSFQIDAGNLDYIDEALVTASLNAVPVTPEALRESACLADAETKAKFSGETLLAGQWSGYVYDVADNGNGTMSFYMSCGVTGTSQYTINNSQVVSLKQTGVCYQYSLYYLIYNE